jgi:hypothetical protein
LVSIFKVNGGLSVRKGHEAVRGALNWQTSAIDLESLYNFFLFSNLFFY